MRNNNGNSILRSAGLFLILSAVYLVVAIPFKVMSVIPGFTDIRPVILLEPVYGIFFGIPGCFAFAVGNVIGDIISNSLKWSSIAGAFIGFAGPFLYFIFWNTVSKTSFSLRTGKSLLKQTFVTLLIAAFETGLLSVAVEWQYPDIRVRLFALTVIINESVFPIALGIPLMILMQEELGFRPATLSRANHRKRP